MPKQKQLLNSHRKATKAKDTIPQTANEYLAVGVDLEEAGEKWRAGDAQKSARFFLRALDDYEAGLRRFPASFDLAYNRARLQFDLAQQPRLLRYIPGPTLDLLRTALASHRYALAICQENNPDLLFNTGQVLTSLGELISEERYRHRDAAVADPLELFQEALRFFQRCLTLQETQILQSDSGPQQKSIEADRDLIDDARKDSFEHFHSVSHASNEDTWATIMEPTTDQALMDTLLAQAETLTSICGLSSVQDINDVDAIDQYNSMNLCDKLLGCASRTGRHHEVALAIAKYRCALADCRFNATALDIPTYEHEIADAYGNFLDSDPDPQVMCDRADAEILFAASLQRIGIRVMESTPENGARLSIVCWKHITKALDRLTAAGKLPNAKNLPRIHLRRGDCELLRRRLGGAPWNYDLAFKSASTLLKNAEIYYRGAARLAKVEAAADEEAEASIKEAVVLAISTGYQNALGERKCLYQSAIHGVIEEMNEEGLLWEEDTKRIKFDDA